jgi:RNA polymerase sigma factor (sigma-70 family)
MKERELEKNLGLEPTEFTQMVATLKLNNTNKTPCHCKHLNKICENFDYFVNCFKKQYNQVSQYDIENNVQEGFIKFYKQLISGNVQYGNLRSFLYTTINRVVIDQHRKKKLLIMDSLILDVLQIAENQSNIAHLEAIYDRCLEVFNKIFEAFKQTNPMHYELIHLHYFENITLADIAREWGISPEAARKRHQKATQELRDSLNALSLKFLKTLRECYRHFDA